MPHQYIIYCDESVTKGARFSNFYGGALVRGDYIEQAICRLNRKKRQLNLLQEVKWQKVTAPYLQKYIKLMDELFALIDEDKIKIRIMFTREIFKPKNLEPYHREHAYFILYYHFIKHGFGLRYSNDTKTPITVRIFFDKLPDTREKRERFKGFICGISHWPEFRKANINILRDQIAEVDSHKHVILQCLDIVIGAMQFRLNNKHIEIPPGLKRRGKRTIAKEKLYKHINAKIRDMYPGFNVGITTGTSNDIKNIWKHSYRHWLFRPKNSKYDDTDEMQ
jgi:hypothetical protein